MEDEKEIKEKIKEEIKEEEKPIYSPEIKMPDTIGIISK